LSTQDKPSISTYFEFLNPIETCPCQQTSRERRRSYTQEYPRLYATPAPSTSGSLTRQRPSRHRADQTVLHQPNRGPDEPSHDLPEPCLQTLVTCGEKGVSEIGGHIHPDRGQKRLHALDAEPEQECLRGSLVVSERKHGDFVFGSARATVTIPRITSSTN
jgi:hypothetical protein